MAEATVTIEYETIPGRKRKVKTVTFADGQVGLTKVIKALTGKDVTGYREGDWCWRPTRNSSVVKVPATLVLKKLTISGDEIRIGRRKESKIFGPNNETFENSPELEEVIVDSNHYEIGGSAFKGCGALREVVLPDGVTEIGWGAFRDCKALRKVILPDGVTEIGDSAFYQCESLFSFEFPLSLKSIGDFTFSGCESFTSANLPDGLVSIGECAFSGCSSLSRVVFPSSLRVVGKNAFSRCKLLESAVFPANLSSIGDGALSFCKSLQYVVIPSCVDDANKLGGDYEGTTVVCDRDDMGEDPLSRRIGYSKCDIVPLTVDGVQNLVQNLCRSRVVSATSREKAAKVSQSSAVAGRITGNADEIADTESLSKYLKVVSEAETSVMQLEEALALGLSTRDMLAEMLNRRKAFESYADKQQAESQQEQFKKRKNNWSAERNAISNGERLSVSDIGAEPSHPQMMSEPTKPSEPKLKKPGLFNRKRVEAENAEAARLYQEALASYQEKLSWVRDENAKLESAYKKEADAWEQRRAAAIVRQLSELGPQPSKISKRSRADSDVTKALKAAVSASEKMCKELEKQLVKANGLLKLAYSANIIFPKYRSIEAMTTMYEYFETGRCTSLKGPDGAYNLYESELRSNAIIGKLDCISDQLSNIQANQYVLFKAVEGVSERLDAMSDNLGEILNETTRISTKVTTMVRNSSEIAYWTKKNAELTDSLGYLIAFAAF